METKKLLMPMALIFVALLFCTRVAKAQSDIPIVMTTYSDNAYWDITFHNDSTNVDYYFNTNNVAYHFFNNQDATLGSVPPGTYTVSFSASVDTYTYEDIYINGQENDFCFTNGLYDYVFKQPVVISSSDMQCSIYAILDRDE